MRMPGELQRKAQSFGSGGIVRRMRQQDAGVLAIERNAAHHRSKTSIGGRVPIGNTNNLQTLDVDLCCPLALQPRRKLRDWSRACCRWELYGALSSGPPIFEEKESKNARRNVNDSLVNPRTPQDRRI